MNTVTTERIDAVATVRVHNPPRNRLNGALTDELIEVIARLERDRGVRAVVLAGARPGMFIDHYELSEILEGTEGPAPPVSPAAAGVLLRIVGGLCRFSPIERLLGRGPTAGVVALLRFHALIERIIRSDKVYVAAIDGPAVGGGFELALACDLRLVADGDFELGLPESDFGLVPGGGGSQLLRRLLGPDRAVELLLDARLLTPAQAVDAGLVHRLTPVGEVLQQAQAIAARSARHSPEMVGSLKRLTRGGTGLRLGRGLAMERAHFLSAASRPSAQALLRQQVEAERPGGLECREGTEGSEFPTGCPAGHPGTTIDAVR